MGKKRLLFPHLRGGILISIGRNDMPNSKKTRKKVKTIWASREGATPFCRGKKGEKNKSSICDRLKKKVRKKRYPHYRREEERLFLGLQGGKEKRGKKTNGSSRHIRSESVWKRSASRRKQRGEEKGRRASYKKAKMPR